MFVCPRVPPELEPGGLNGHTAGCISAGAWRGGRGWASDLGGSLREDAHVCVRACVCMQSRVGALWVVRTRGVAEGCCTVGGPWPGGLKGAVKLGDGFCAQHSAPRSSTPSA